MTAVLSVLIGLFLLVLGAELMVKGAVSIAHMAGISPHVIGLTVIAFGTSAPELAVSLKAALEGSPGIAFGNLVGSNIANILLMIGVVGLIAPFVCSGASLRRDSLALAGGTVVFVALILSGSIGFWQGALMLVALTGYLLYCYYDERRAGAEKGLHAQEADEYTSVVNSSWRAWLYTLGGLAIMVFAARLLVDGAVDVAEALGVSETVIGLTIVALGTSAPELVTTIVAVIHRHGEVALGNIIGSNIFNTISIPGMVAVVHPLVVPADLLGFDIWFMVGATAVFLVVVLSFKAIPRLFAAAFLASYMLFVYAEFFPLDALLAGATGILG